MTDPTDVGGPLNADKKPMPEALDWLPTVIDQANVAELDGRTADVTPREEADDARAAAQP